MSAAGGEALGAGMPPLRSLAWVAGIRRAWAWVAQQRAWPGLQPRSRRMQVQETVQLGEKRFVSILRVDGKQFLIGGSAGGVTLLSELKPEAETQTFAAVMTGGSREACA